MSSVYCYNSHLPSPPPLPARATSWGFTATVLWTFLSVFMCLIKTEERMATGFKLKISIQVMISQIIPTDNWIASTQLKTTKGKGGGWSVTWNIRQSSLRTKECLLSRDDNFIYISKWQNHHRQPPSAKRLVRPATLYHQHLKMFWQRKFTAAVNSYKDQCRLVHSHCRGKVASMHEKDIFWAPIIMP